jgi:predicted hydrolase (HD superfamily)
MRITVNANLKDRLDIDGQTIDTADQAADALLGFIKAAAIIWPDAFATPAVELEQLIRTYHPK